MTPKNFTLSEYNKKRDFSITGEPEGKAATAEKSGKLRFVVQKHDATRLHYDFRLELDGVMKSWAVTRGPSFDPADKRLAVQTEDHPIEYNKFEGIIPDKQYGAGPVIVWDNGTWTPEGDIEKDYKKGRMTFTLQGHRLKGRWHLVLMHGRKEKRANWLLIKGDDDYALKPEENKGYLDRENFSVVSGRTIQDILDKVAPKNTEIVAEKKEKQERDVKPKTKAASKTFDSLQKKYGQVELATLVEFPPSSDEWWHEIKYDGYRLLAFIQDGNVILQTRGNQDWTHKFLTLAGQLSKLNVKSAIIDGEAVVLDEKGSTSFSALQTALSDGNDKIIEFYAFDLLYLNGEDYTTQPLTKRKESLKKILSAKVKSTPHVHYSEHFESNPDLLPNACNIGAEGIVSKLKNSAYRGRRTHDWVKSKCGLEQEFVIGGFMPSTTGPNLIGSLLLGYYKDQKLFYAGKVGTGFTRQLAQDLYARLKPLERKSNPFQGGIDKSLRGCVWVEPSTLCEIKFWEWTADKHIRHASFKGVREDKAPSQVHEEIPEKSPARRKPLQKKEAVTTTSKNFTVEGIVISHPDREVYPGLGITKGEIAAYYAKAMPYMLPFAENRLISLLRCTGTINDEMFFQRSPMQGGKGNVHGLTVDHKGTKHNYMYIDSPGGIIELAQMGAIEFHAWQSHVKDTNKPDQIIFDLDPAEDVPYEAVKLAALDIRNRLKTLGLDSFPRLSGGKGVHVTVPLKPQKDWELVKAFARDFCMTMQKDVPEAYIATMSKEKRKGKIFLDYLRNDFSATAIIPFSLRARANATVAVPISWKELDNSKSAADYTFFNVNKKFNKATMKLIEDFLAMHQTLPR